MAQNTIAELMKKKVFLGGTSNNTLWRDELIKMLDSGIEYFNPIVSTWTKECKIEEIKQRKACDVLLYVITPQMLGVYSIAEVVEDSIKNSDKTIFVRLQEYEGMKFEDRTWSSLESVEEMVIANGAKVFTDLEQTAMYINQICG